MSCRFFDCTADLVGQLNGNGQKGMLQIDAPPVENFWLRHWSVPSFDLSSGVCGGFAAERPAFVCKYDVIHKTESQCCQKRTERRP